MLTFEPFSIKTLQKIQPYIKKSNLPFSDLSIGALFLWQGEDTARFCVWKDTLVIMQTVGEQPAFCYPIGENAEEMLLELKNYARDNHLPLRFYAIDEERLKKIKSVEGFKSVTYSFDSRWSDYIYNFDEIKTFKGKKFNGQRNHINKFKKLYGDIDVRFLEKEDISLVKDMLSSYAEEHTDASRLEKIEFSQTKKLLSVYKSFNLYAAGLFVDGKIAAFSIGEVVGDTLVIHVEKALKKFVGAYPTMFFSFARLMDNLGEYNLKYINREDDAGDEGLRTSKMQYHPIERRNKYVVHVNSPAAKMPKDVCVKSGDIFLTPFFESDKKAYLELNTDEINNEFWGYDYHSDLSIAENIDENTFYDSTVFDVNVGDSVNFAIRLSEKGEMIGEVILWNFTADGYGEIGARVLPKFQKKGYGLAAFKGATDFAVNVLGVKLKARCDKKNTPSSKMIEKSGFRLSKKDGNFLYYEY